jgi:hypothetical protein
VNGQVFPELQVLAARLLTQPIAQMAAGKALTMYGYVRTDEAHPAYADACVKLLTHWSHTAGWRFGAAFRDLGVSSESLTRPGFEGLLDVLRLPDNAEAIVVHQTHLSAVKPIAKQLRAAVHLTGTSLRVLADELSPPG